MGIAGSDYSPDHEEHPAPRQVLFAFGRLGDQWDADGGTVRTRANFAEGNGGVPKTLPDRAQ